MPARLEGDKFTSLGGDAICAGRIREGDDAVGIADIEGVANERHAERLAQSLHEDPASFGNAVTVAIPQ